MDNFYCNGLWFESYKVARVYADDLLAVENKYCVVFTKAEVDSITQAIDKAIDHEMNCPAVDSFGCHCDDIINHEMECGK